MQSSALLSSSAAQLHCPRGASSRAPCRAAFGARPPVQPQRAGGRAALQVVAAVSAQAKEQAQAIPQDKFPRCVSLG